MNKVDKLVKRSLLEYPSLYSCRLKVLRHLFLTNGNGYEWNSKGCLVNICDKKRFDGKMKFSDLEEREKNRKEMQDKYKTPLDAFWAAKNEEEKMLRRYREKHIDLYATKHDFYDNFRYEDLEHFDVDWSAFRDAPYGSIDMDWVHAMEEVIRKINYAYNTLWGLHYDDPLKGDKAPEPSMFSRMPRNWQENYLKLQAIRRKLNEQSGSLKKAAETSKMIREILEKHNFWVDTIAFG